MAIPMEIMQKKRAKKPAMKPAMKPDYTKVKRPNGILYFIVYIILYPFLILFFRLEVDRSGYKPPKGPFIVLCNHSSFMDFLLAMLVVYPKRLNAVAAQKFYLYKPLDKLLPVMGCIPKNLFDPDVRSIKRIMTVIKNGGHILMYPEGRCSTDGVYAGIHTSTGKLIKKLGIPVISCHIEGGYVCMPFWRKGIRLGRERVSLANLLSADDTQNKTVDEINAAIDDRLSGSEAPPPPTRKPFRTFRARSLAEGLHNILYLCPKCGNEFTMETKGNTIRCTACGNSAELDSEAKLNPSPGSVTPENIHEWFQLQVAHEQQRLGAVAACGGSGSGSCTNCTSAGGSSIDSDSDSAGDNDITCNTTRPIIEHVTVRKPAKKAGEGMECCGDGLLRLEPDGWHFNGTLYGESATLFFPIDTVPAIPFDPNDNFQIYAHGSFFMFTPDDARKCVKYAILGECAYHLFASRVCMTKAP